MKERVKNSLMVILCVLAILLSYKSCQDSEKNEECRNFADQVYDYATQLESENARIRILYDKCRRSHAMAEPCDSMEESRLKVILAECSAAVMDCTWDDEG